MKRKMMILALALILALSVSVPVLADNTVVHDGSVTTITDENGNTLTIEEVDESGDSGSVTVTKPTSAPTETSKPGGTGTAQTGTAPANGSSNSSSGAGAHDEMQTAVPGAQDDPASEADEDGKAAADDAQTSVDADDAKDKTQEKAQDDSAPKGANTTRIVILAVIAVLCVAGAVYLAADLKKKNKG